MSIINHYTFARFVINLALAVLIFGTISIFVSFIIYKFFRTNGEEEEEEVLDVVDEEQEEQEENDEDDE